MAHPARKTLLLSMIALLGALPASATKRDCRPFSRVSFHLDLGAGKVSLAAQPGHPTSLCMPLPDSGHENLKIILKRGKKPLFSRDIFVGTTRYLDVLAGKERDGALSGGARPEKQLYFTTYLPTKIAASLTSDARVTAEFVSLESHQILVRARPILEDSR